MSSDKNTSSSFMFEFGLVVPLEQEKTLLTRLDCARQLYNACLGESLRRLKLMKESRWYQAVIKLPKGKDRTREFNGLNIWFGFRKYDLHDYAKMCRNGCHIKDHIDSLACQKVADRAFFAVQEYAFGKKGKPRFKGKNQFDSVEGKNNASGIKWKFVEVKDKKEKKKKGEKKGKRETPSPIMQAKRIPLDAHLKQGRWRITWLGLELEPRLDPKDKHGVQAHALEHKVKFVRIVRRKIKGKNRFFAQLVLKGIPKQKHEDGNETVGLDLGPSTIACVGETNAFLDGFCSELLPIQKEIRKIQRKMDRSRRAMNPDNYNPDKTIKPGKKTWKVSARYLADKDRLSEMHRKLAGTRKRLHGEMANRVLSLGVNINTEDVSYRAWQKMFGKSVSFRAPGMFVDMLCRKAENAGGKVNKFPLSNALSQTCHNCETVKKKALSTRWHRCDCGITAQRDLYSAFLAQNVSGSCLDICQAKQSWPGAELLLRCAISRLCQSANGFFPSSFGVSRRQSGSHTEGG